MDQEAVATHGVPVVARTAAEICSATTHLELWPGVADDALTDDLPLRAPLLRTVYVHATGTVCARARARPAARATAELHSVARGLCALVASVRTDAELDDVLRRVAASGAQQGAMEAAPAPADSDHLAARSSAPPTANSGARTDSDARGAVPGGAWAWTDGTETGTPTRAAAPTVAPSSPATPSTTDAGARTRTRTPTADTDTCPLLVGTGVGTGAQGDAGPIGALVVAPGAQPAADAGAREPADTDTDAQPPAKRQRQTDSLDGWSALRLLWPLLPKLPCLRGVTIHHSGPSPIDDADRARAAAAIPYVRCADGAKVLVVCGKQDAEWWRATVQRASNLSVVAVAPHPDPYPDTDGDIDLDAFTPP